MYKLLAIFLVLVQSGIAQTATWPDLFFVDKIGSVYTMANNQLKKKDVVSGKELVYNNPALGELSDVDIANPNTIVLFYEDAQVLVVLNRDLNLYRSPIDISQLNLRFRVNYMAATPQRTIWLSDNSNQSLHLYDVEQNAIVSEVPLLSLLNSNEEIIGLDSDLNNVYIQLKNGIYLNLDGLGVYIKKINIEPNVLWLDGMAYFIKDNVLKSYNPSLMKEKTIGPISSEYCHFYVTNRSWQILTKEGNIKKGALN